MKLILIIFSFLLLLFLIPLVVILLVFTSPFICIYFSLKLFSNQPIESEPKKETSFFDFAIKQVIETQKNKKNEQVISRSISPNAEGLKK